MGISASELRFGNLVIGNNIHGDPVFIVIGELGEAKYNATENIIYTTDMDVDGISPAELTEEWLLKFGFRKLDKYTFSKNGWFVYQRKRGFVTGSKKRETKLQFVHQLQNWWFGNTMKELKLIPSTA